MIPMPDWANELLKKTTCPFCHAQFTTDDVIACGIRKTRDNKTCFFFEKECRRCNHPCLTTVTSRPMDIEDFAMEIIDMISKEDMDKGKTKSGEIIEKEEEDESGIIPLKGEDDSALLEPKDDNKNKKPNKHRPDNEQKGKITDADMNKARKTLKSLETHNDFLLLIGLTQEDIDRYKYIKPKEDTEDESE